MKKRKNLIRLLAVALVTVIFGSFIIGCDGRYSAKTHTYSSTMTSDPLNWNSHAWENDTDRTLMSFLTDDLYEQDIVFNSDGTPKMIAGSSNVEMEWMPAMASAYPVDVTNEYRGKFNIAANSTNMEQVWRIALREGMKWENGDIINADTYIESLKRYLDPDMKNRRGLESLTYKSALAGSSEYLMSKSPDVEWFFDFDENENFPASEITHITFANYVEVFDTNYQYYLDSYTSLFDKATLDNVAKWKAKAGKEGYIPVTAADVATLENDFKNLLALFGMGNMPEAWTYLGVKWDGVSLLPPTDWSKVGLVKKSDYVLDFVMASSVELKDFYVYGGVELVHPATYDANIVSATSTAYVTTKYNTSKETTMSFGPFKMESFQKGKEIVLTRNTNFYGYSLERNKGYYPTDKIRIQIVADHNTELLKFLSGEIDDVSLLPAEVPTYKDSSNKQNIGSSSGFSMRLYLNSDRAKLEAIQTKTGSKSKNITVLANASFRKALSLAINRPELAKFSASGVPGYVLLNDQYFEDYDSVKMYRNNPIAKKALVDFYGLQYGAGKTYATLDDAYNAITGFELANAKAAFNQAWTDEQASMTGDKKVHIVVTIGPGRTDEQKAPLEEYFRQITEAAKGTSFEGKISFEYIETPADGKSRYNEINDGNIEMMFGAMNGATVNLTSAINASVGRHKDYKTGTIAAGFNNGKTVSIDLTQFANRDDVKALKNIVENDTVGTSSTPDTITTVVGNVVTLRLGQWVDTVNPDSPSSTLIDHRYAGILNGTQALPKDINLLTLVISSVETAILGEYQEIPLYADGTTALYSKKFSYLFKYQDIRALFGGLKYVTYHYTDGEWAKFITKSKNLDYTK